MSEIPYSTITATGPDAFEFLQAQLAADLTKMPRDSASQPFRSAWCNPKGRVICIFDVASSDTGFELSVPANLVEVVEQRMTMFRFRSKVEFNVAESQALDTKAAIEKLCAGIADIQKSQSEKFTPHMLNLDLLGFVSLDKGCYPGQEIVARTHYRGASKRRMFRFTSDAPVSPGDRVSEGERDIGEVVNAIGADLLAVVPVKSASSKLSIGTSALIRQDLPYSTDA